MMPVADVVTAESTVGAVRYCFRGVTVLFGLVGFYYGRLRGGGRVVSYRVEVAGAARKEGVGSAWALEGVSGDLDRSEEWERSTP